MTFIKAREVIAGEFRDGFEVAVIRRLFYQVFFVKYQFVVCRGTVTFQYLERDRDLFLFQVYTGYYYRDLLIFTKDHLQMDEEYGHIILGARDKNGNQTIIPLFKFPYAQTILEKYRSRAGDQLVFDKRFLIEEPVYNRHLKDIAKLTHPVPAGTCSM